MSDVQVLGLPQVQAENVQQAEALVRVSDKLERLEGDVRDTQGLLGALHGAESCLILLVQPVLTVIAVEISHIVLKGPFLSLL